MKSTPHLSASRLSTYQACLLEARAHRVLVGRFRSWLKEFGLNSNEWAILGALTDHAAEGMRLSQISTLLHLHAPQGTSMVTSLEQRGLVVRKAEDLDARSRRAHLTKEGKKLVEKAERQLRGQMRDYLRDVSRPALDTYLGVLDYLANQETSPSDGSV